MGSSSSWLTKGAIVLQQPDTGAHVRAIPFQYNPDSIRRKLQPQGVGDQPDRTEVMRLKGPPVETISCEVVIDATNLLETSNARAAEFGIQPELSLLELLVYPSSQSLVANEMISHKGRLEILPVSSYLTVFAWGNHRITPVRLTDLEITEEAFDNRLNPILAKVALSMRVLNVNDVGFLSPAGAMYMAYQMGKEAMASRLEGKGWGNG